ncbi:hypothetical protein O152_gp126 [Pseudomonas phage PaBG]|uniref:Uncharacterized protein n=1 Tax=Pseudomonas phage PaBG TaxID=1335230 RepID=S5VZK8_9CAUD|nr:hypothetical protein O152_gp126 [Pseudomonas phage PaBG]AGS82010.1 hypothetical protein PaBG_00126 [Pseudomonas phage PaBG]
MAKDKTKKRNTANRLSRTDKIAKRLKNISAKTSFKAKSAMFTFTVFARQAVEIGGFLVQDGTDAVMLRHKRTSASQKTVVSRFSRSDVVEVFGAVGEVSAVTVFREVAIREVVGRLVEDKGGIMTIQTASGETVKLYQRDDVRIEVRAEDEAAAGGEGKKSKKDKKAKAEKAEGKKSKKGKKKKADEDDDDLDD